MELIFRLFGMEFSMCLGPTEYVTEEIQGGAPLSAHLDFGFGIDPLNLDNYWEDED